MTKAAIAIGSNSTRLFCKNGMGEELRLRKETKLFSYLDARGFLPQEAILRAVTDVQSLKQEAIMFGASTIYLYATSASRDAKNQEVLIQMLKEKTGLCLNVLTGQEEAELAFYSAKRGNSCAVLDIGGGSTEMTFGNEQGIYALKSAQLGATRLAKLHPIFSIEEGDTVCALVTKCLEREYAYLLHNKRPDVLIGIGGTCATSAAIKTENSAHDARLEGVVLTKEDVDKQFYTLACMTLEQRENVVGLYKSRVGIMPNGLAILKATLELFDFDHVTVSIKNNLDALLMRV